MKSVKVGEVLFLIVFCIFILPSLVALLFWSHEATHNPRPEKIEEGILIGVDLITPWVLNIIIPLAGLGVVGGLIAAGVIYIAKEYNLL